MAMYQQAPGSKRKVITTHHDGIPIAFLIAREQALAQATQDRIDKRPIAGYRAFGRPQLAITPKKAPPPRQEPEGDDESDDDFEISMAPPPRR
jgi:hypothetical protein